MLTLDSHEPSGVVPTTARWAIVFEGCANAVENLDWIADRTTYTLYNADTNIVLL
ncbi:MAG: hypothetical protein HC941_14840 [Microcoleus sp. SU_5_3]|nr:hypothetical protein [Microcoleus sp. SU_5_3]